MGATTAFASVVRRRNNSCCASTGALFGPRTPRQGVHRPANATPGDPRRARTISVSRAASCPRTHKTKSPARRRWAQGPPSRALLLIGFADGLRRSELATINLVDFERVREGIILTIRWSKTDQDGVGRKIGIGNVMSCFLLVNRARCPSARMSKSIICGCVVGLKLPKKSLYWANVTMPQSLVRERS
jgi:hypothetical protein